MTETFGSALRRLRREAGMSQAQLALATGYEKSFVSKVENGHRPGGGMFAARCDEVLGARGELEALAPRDVRTANPDDDERLVIAVRRPSRVDKSTVDSLAVMLDGQRRLEDRIGAAPLIRPVTAQLDVVQALVREARGPIRRDVLDVAAQWAQYAGWLHTSVGQGDVARQWWERATDWALEIGHTDLFYHVVSFRAHLAGAAGDIPAMIGLSDVARRHGTDTAGRAFDAFQSARGHAIMGAADAADRAIGEAVALSQEATPDGTAPWSYYYLAPGFWVLAHGVVLRYLGYHDPRRLTDAITLLTSGLDELPASMCRSDWAGDYWCALAKAYVAAHDAESARRAASEAAGIATVTGSPRLARRADRVLRSLD